MIERIKQLLNRSSAPETDDEEPEDAPQEPSAGDNLLLISDLHLGEACKEHSRIEYLKRGSELDADLCAFLEHHATARPGGRPWRLVLGGDLLDFLQVTMTPAGTTGDALRFGLGTREDESRWKLQRLMERHRRVFVYLADFVGEGHSLEIVQGNHDGELFWPQVQQTLVEGLVDLYFGAEAHPELTPEAFAARIRFHPWFFFKPGVLYFEHGHRFDTNCATPPQLYPLRSGDEAELTQPVSALAIRYFANLESGFRTHDKEHWGLSEYVGYYRRRGVAHVVEVSRRYLGLLSRSAHYYREHGRIENPHVDEAHEAGLRAHAEAGPLDEETLRELDAMSAASVTSSVTGLATILCLWELSAIAAFGLVSSLALLTSWGWAVDLPLVVGVTGLAVFWRQYNRGRYPTNIKSHLDEVAAGKRVELGEDLIETHPLATGECVLRIAPLAAEVAAGEPHEVRGPAGLSRLTLNRVEDLGDTKSAIPLWGLTPGSRTVVDLCCHVGSFESWALVT